MEITHKIIYTTVLFFVFQIAYAQNEKKFCKAVAKMNLKKTGRIIKKLVKKNKEGVAYFDEALEKNQYSLSAGVDLITYWLKGNDCVEDAFWDKCQAKPAIFPGHSTIGVRFKTPKGVIEKCFLIQEGITGQINIFGWKPKLKKSKMILVYKTMFDCDNFIYEQKSNCRNIK